MVKHAIALGYFFLAVFCVNSFYENQPIWDHKILLGAKLAALTGCGYLLSACSAQIRALTRTLKEGVYWLVREAWLVKDAPRPPHSEQKIDEDHTA